MASVLLVATALAGTAAAQGGADAAALGDGLDAVEKELRRKQAVQEEKAAAARQAEAKRAAEARARSQAAEEARRQAEETMRLEALRRSRSGYGMMVAVPAGEFMMGCNESVDSECGDDEKPARQVALVAYSIDQTEVTVAAYRSCVSAGSCTAPNTDPGCNWGAPDRDQHPVNCIDWDQATAFCRWAGKRLPTEQEWEKAARGTEGRKFPWGNLAYSRSSGLAKILAVEVGFFGTSPVGSFPGGDSPYGAVDIAGNVWEWTSDPDPSGLYRSSRGGSWFNQPIRARASNREWEFRTIRLSSGGFRCAQ
ncbi:formylglycine-generating enzyme family protein [Myxococcota bacterium]|nr:formylglycine-generating enzyme family protein [Myxococcota bacterium]